MSHFEDDPSRLFYELASGEGALSPNAPDLNEYLQRKGLEIIQGFAGDTQTVLEGFLNCNSAPLFSERTYKSRRSLLLLALIIAVICYTKEVPSKLTTLGMTFQPDQQFILGCVLLIVTVYTFAMFWVNAAQEYAAWKKKYQGAEGHLRLTSEKLVQTCRLARLADTKFYVKEIERGLLPKPKLQIETFDKTIEDILHNPEGDPKHIWDRPRKWVNQLSRNLEYWLPILFATLALVSLIVSLSSLREALT